MDWDDKLYPTIKKTVHVFAKKYAQKTNRPSFMYTELYSEGMFQAVRIVGRYDKNKGDFERFLKKNIRGYLQNNLRDNRLVRVKRKDNDTYNAFYSLKKRTHATDSEIYKQLNITEEEFERIKHRVNNITEPLDVNKHQHSSAADNVYQNVAIETLKTNVPEHILEALIEIYVNKKPAKAVRKKFGLSATALNKHINAIKRDCAIFVE